MNARADLAVLPGIKEAELIKLGPCVICGKHLLHSAGLPLFYRVTISRAGFDAGAVQRRVGLGMMLGSDPLARVMGQDEDIAKVIAGPRDVVVHETCAGMIGHLLELMPEKPEASASS